MSKRGSRRTVGEARSNAVARTDEGDDELSVLHQLSFSFQLLLLPRKPETCEKVRGGRPATFPRFTLLISEAT